MVCEVEIVTATVSVIIRVDGFQAINGGQTVTIEFPGLVNPATAYQVNVKTIVLQGRVRSQQAYNSVFIGTTAPAGGTIGLIGTVSNHALSNTDVSSLTNYTFKPNIPTTYTAPGIILIQLPFYDVGWIPTSNNIKCQITNTFYNCVPYPGADYIKIPLTGA